MILKSLTLLLCFQFLMIDFIYAVTPNTEYQMHLEILAHEVKLNSRNEGSSLISINKHTMEYLSTHAHENVVLLRKMIINQPFLVIAISKNKQLFAFAGKQRIKVYHNVTSAKEVEKWIRIFDHWLLRKK